MQYCNQLHSVTDRKPYTMLCRNQSVADEQLFAPVWLFLCDPSSAVAQLDTGVIETIAKDGWKAGSIIPGILPYSRKILPTTVFVNPKTASVFKAMAAKHQHIGCRLSQTSE